MKHRVCFMGLSLLLAGVLIRSISFAPLKAQNRLSAVPAHAHMVYNNKNPDWFLSFFPTLGHGADFTTRPDESRVATSTAPQRHSKSLDPLDWFHWLEQYPLAVATVPFGGPGQRDAWVAVSELGAPAAFALRWRLMLFSPAGVSPARPYAVWPVWKVEHPSIPTWLQVRISITEGLLICSVSGDSHDIYKLLDTVDGRTASMAD